MPQKPTTPGTPGQTPGVGQRAGEVYDKGSDIWNFVNRLFRRHPPQERSPCFPYGPLTEAMPFNETSSPNYYRERIKSAYAKVYGSQAASALSDQQIKTIFLRYWAPRCESMAHGRRYSPDPGVPNNVWVGEAAAVRRAAQADFENLLRNGPIDSSTSPPYGGHGGDDPRPDPNAPYDSKTPTQAGFGGIVVVGLIAALALLGPKLK